MIARHVRASYRQVLRELHRISIAPGRVNQSLLSSFRTLFAQYQHNQDVQSLERDVQNAILFLRSQREYKSLLERYSPLIDLTAQERVHATARRVGLDLPVTHKPQQPAHYGVH